MLRHLFVFHQFIHLACDCSFVTELLHYQTYTETTMANQVIENIIRQIFNSLVISYVYSRGNVISQPPYEKGFPGCTKFGLAFSNNWRGLCSKFIFYETFSRYPIFLISGKPTNYRLDFSNYIG